MLGKERGLLQQENPAPRENFILGLMKVALTASLFLISLGAKAR
jgi:hypothetical protein